ncbi:MAG: DUF6062 family protein [Marvinbryantia sp.]|uniref:DUF6062 family protein n=1 Tax=Marvinbryantia sp. TaxID=2496532 RepID=UPI00266F98FE|nr:DUF6062 family protein [uncultured Marvinbryantia sp.]
MKESIYTIPLMDAFKANDECPFCFIERNLEQHAINFALGSQASYMEDDVRAQTDKVGFCRHHYKMMFDYGNRLGSALILSTHFKKLNAELSEQIQKFSPGKSSFFGRMKKSSPDTEAPKTSIGAWVAEKEAHCYVCDHIHANYGRYIDTFFEMYVNSDEFRTLFENSKGFCLHHFSHLVETADTRLDDKHKKAFYQALFSLMQTNMKRLEEEVTWFTEKYDYRNKDKDWGNSRDSVQRCMQKDRGGYPADPVFTSDR